jgi:hypothetical protein
MEAVAMSRSDEETARILAMIRRADPNKKWAQKCELSAFATKLLSRGGMDVAEQAHWLDVIERCERSMRFWARQPKFEIQKAIQLRKKMKAIAA